MEAYTFKNLFQILSDLAPTPACEGEEMVSLSHMRRLKLRGVKRRARGHTAHWW